MYGLYGCYLAIFGTANESRPRTAIVYSRENRVLFVHMSTKFEYG